MLDIFAYNFFINVTEPWFKVDEKDPVAYAKIEIVEAADMKPSDLNGYPLSVTMIFVILFVCRFVSNKLLYISGFADPYVKGHLGGYRFRTKIQKKTLAPKWQEEFRIPIITWDSNNVLVIEVRDKDRFYDDILGFVLFLNIGYCFMRFLI
jgi:hypothetical protein